MSEFGNIYQKLAYLQKELKAPKSQYNSFGGYKYRNCEDILEAVKPLLAKVECLVLLSDTVEQIGGRYYVKAVARLVDCENDNQQIAVASSAREEESKKGMDGSQITGASSSYARKYALNGLLAIDDAKDSDTTNKGVSASETASKSEVEQKATTKQIEVLSKVYTGENLARLLSANRITKIEDLPKKKASEILAKLGQKKED